MKGYSKIKLVNSSSKSRSIDFSDQTLNTTTPRIQKPIITSNNKPSSIQYEDDDYKHYSVNQQQQAAEQDHTNYLPNQKLTKNQLGLAPPAANGSTTTTTDDDTSSSNRFKIEKQNSTGRALQSAVIRAMSIRRSSSVSSERYSRIHDQYANTFDVDYGHHEEQQQDFKYARSKSNVKKHNKGSILKACKRIFGL